MIRVLAVPRLSVTICLAMCLTKRLIHTNTAGTESLIQPNTDEIVHVVPDLISQGYSTFTPSKRIEPSGLIL